MEKRTEPKPAHTRKRLLGLGIIAIFINITFSTPAEAANTYKGNGIELTKGKEYPVCLELKQILNRPENSQSIAPQTETKDIVFPASYKHFTPLIWTPITYQEARDHFDPGYLDQILATNKKNAVEVEKDWDGKGAYLFEKAEIDYDTHPPSETMIRYRFPGMGKGNCLLTNSAPNPTRDTYNPRRNGRTSGIHTQCEFFIYKGVYYAAYTYYNVRMSISRPRSSGYDFLKNKEVRWYAYSNDVCAFLKK